MKKSPLRGEYFIGGQLPGSPGQSWRVASRLAKNKEIRIVTVYDSKGSYAGRAEQSGSNTRYYDRKGSYAGQKNR